MIAKLGFSAGDTQTEINPIRGTRYNNWQRDTYGDVQRTVSRFGGGRMEGMCGADRY
jgi:hypothetical protein